MDHPETKNYRWPGDILKYLRLSKDTTLTASKYQTLKGQMERMCGKFATNMLKSVSEPMREKVITFSKIVAGSVHPSPCEVEIGDYDEYEVYSFNCSAHARFQPIKI